MNPSGGLGNIGKGSKFRQPSCVPIPASTTEFIVRLSNVDVEGMHYKTRVQNEVGMLTLASAALRNIKPAVVPRVFGWSSASREHSGWILEELMPGVPLAEAFEKTMSLDQKKRILAQMAEILKALQEYPLPDSIECWGGVTFDDNGAIVSAPLTSVGTGPWSSFEDFYRGCLEAAITEADSNLLLQGWRVNGIRERVDTFIQHGLPVQFRHLTSKQDKIIIHADFSECLCLHLPKELNLTEPFSTVAWTDIETPQLLITYCMTLLQTVLQHSLTLTLRALCTRHTSSSALLVAMVANFPAGQAMELHGNRRLLYFGLLNLPAIFHPLCQVRERVTMA